MLTIPSYANIYAPPGFQTVIGAVQIIHGAGEHQGRYQKLARYLANNGYAVITSDLRGHGKNIKRNIQLGYFGDNGANNLVSDIHDLTRVICERYPNVPYFLIGQGLGALVAISYFKKFDNFLDGMIISGVPQDTSNSPTWAKCQFMLNFKGEYHRTASIKLPEYPSNPASFLTSDAIEMKKYEADELCGFSYTLNGYKTYRDLLINSYRSGSWILKNKEVPIRILAGSKDPSAGSKYKGSKIASLFRSHGYENIDIKIFSGLKHDIYNDVDNEIVFDYIVEELNNVSVLKN